MPWVLGLISDSADGGKGFEGRGGKGKGKGKGVSHLVWEKEKK